MSVNTVVPIFAAEWLVTLLCNRGFESTNLDVRFFVVLLSLFLCTFLASASNLATAIYCKWLLYPARTRWGTCLECFSQEGRSSELRLRRGVGQAVHTLNNPQVECAGVLLCVIRE